MRRTRRCPTYRLPFGTFVVVQLPSGQSLGFQKVDDPTPGKNRMHLDLTTDGDLSARVQQLEAAGARKIAEREMPGFGWVTLADPAGNEFCVATGH
jgi:predicted enzyme related to lactoylglutathione lyase